MKKGLNFDEGGRTATASAATTTSVPEAKTVTETSAPPAPAALVPAQPTAAALKAPVRLGIAPQSLEEGYRLASLMAKSTLVPKNFQNKPEDVLVAIELGMEIGLAPMQALQSIAVINGRPSVWGDGFLAVIMAASVYQDHDEYYEVAGQRVDGLDVDDLKKDDTCAVCTFLRRGKATPVTRRFSIGKAKKAGLWGKEGPWQTYPDRMLLMRARSWAGRDAFPDILRGITTAEEAVDTPVAETFHQEAPAPAPREVRRISASAPAQEPLVGAAGRELVELLATVTSVTKHGGGDSEQYYTVTLGDGTIVEAHRTADATELEKFAGTDHQLRVVAEKVVGALVLQTFAIAD